jgi:SAM-dependent methyltransferase
MVNYFRMARWLYRHDRTSFYALRTVATMHPGRVAPHVAEILSFINHRYGAPALAEYSERVEGLRHLQREFDKTGSYRATRYTDVKAVDDDAYKLTLLLSFICNNHRFEILSELKKFLGDRSVGPANLLSVGYGTGYELKLARDLLPDWRIEGFDSSPESFGYATDLLAFFGCKNVDLRTESFPLEASAEIECYRNTFGKIILCELLEHLEQPAMALRNVRAALHDGGQIFLTMAVRIAQEDHLFLYETADQARQQVIDSGFKIIRERLAPLALFPFAESDREKLFQKGNYICVAEKAKQ